MGFAADSRGGHRLDLYHARASQLAATGVVERYPAERVVPFHSHPSGHLSYGSTGVVVVQASTG